MAKKKPDDDGVNYTVVPTPNLKQYLNHAIQQEQEWFRTAGAARSALARAERQQQKWVVSLRAIRKELASRA
jgi:hypothetical protein